MHRDATNPKLISIHFSSLVSLIESSLLLLSFECIVTGGHRTLVVASTRKMKRRAGWRVWDGKATMEKRHEFIKWKMVLQMFFFVVFHSFVIYCESRTVSSCVYYTTYKCIESNSNKKRKKCIRKNWAFPFPLSICLALAAIIIYVFLVFIFPFSFGSCGRAVRGSGFGGYWLWGGMRRNGHRKMR